MKRWIIIIAVSLAVLAVVAVIAVQVVLMTDLPRRLILDAVVKKTGLGVQVESMSIRWSGRTTVRGATVATPLDDETFLTLDTLQLHHHSLPVLLLTRSLGLRSVRVERPELSLWRDEQGRWNVQNVADHLASLPSESEGPSLSLPNIEVEEASVQIAEPNGPSRAVGPIHFEGTADRGAVWRFALEVPDGGTLSGELIEGGNWAHRVTFDAAPTVALQESVLGQALADLRVAGRWEGRMESGNLRGALRLAQLKAGSASIAGEISVATQPGSLTVSPESLVLSEPNLGDFQPRVAGGRIRLSQAVLSVDGVRVRTSTGAARVDGRWDLDSQAGDLTTTWAGHMPGQVAEYNGVVQAEVQSPRHGLKQAHLTASAKVQGDAGTWRVAVETDAAGSEWGQSLWKTTLREFSWNHDDREIDLGGATAEVSVDAPRVRLASLSLPRDAKVGAKAQLDWQTGQWSAQFDTTGLRLAQSDQSAWNIRVRGEGDSRNAVIAELQVAEGLSSMTGKGQISFETRQVHDAHISAQWPDRAPSGQGGQTQNRGQWTAEVDVSGSVQPLALETDSVLKGRNVRLGKRQVAQLEVPVQAQVDATRVAITTSPFTLLGGRWQFSGRHDLVETETQLDLTIENLSLRNAAEMAGSPIQCGGQASAQLQVTVPGFDFSRTLAYGGWEVADLSIPPFDAATGQGQIRIAGGLVQCDEIELRQDQGHAKGALRFRLDQPQRLSINFTSTDWPTRIEGQPVVLVTDSDVEVELDLQAKSADGKGSLAARLLADDNQFGRFDTKIEIAGRTLMVDELRGTVLGGSVEGQARIPLDQLTTSSAQVKWQDIHPDQIASWLPQASRVGGVASGSLVAHQTSEQERPLGPLRIDVQSQIADGRFGAAEIRDANVVAYLSSSRFLVERCNLQLLGGQIAGWARISPHAGQLYLAVSADANDLDINQIAQAADPNAPPVVGRLSGSGTLLTSADWRRLSGQADLKITKSDLGNNAVIHTLYDTLSLDLGPSEPEGTGSVELLFAGTRVRIPSFVYFNRGVEVRGTATIGDLGLGAESPLDGYAVGSTRVLKGVKLPGVRQLDRLMSSLQNGMASVTIGGTLGQTKVKVVPLPVVGEALRGLLWNQLRQKQ